MNRCPSPIEAARRRHSLAEAAERTGIWLPANAGTITVRCPMPSHGHPDRTPSLRLYLDDGTWYCFGCSDRAGDVVQWVKQTEGVGWRQAIEILDSGRPLTNAWAGIAGHDHPRRATARTPCDQPDLDRTPSSRVQEALDVAWAHCTIGPLHAKAVAFLAGRHIDVTVLERYTGRPEAGHTPSYGPGLVARLLADGFTTDVLVDAGLAHRNPDGRISDYYRYRVLIPIRNDDGRIAGIVGRNVGDARWPKYKNAPRTVLYDKSINLYRPLPAPRHPNGRVIVVEGTIDAMAIAVAAVKMNKPHLYCPVTQSGKEFSAHQLDAVLRLHPGPLVIGFDGDAAGRESNIRLARAVLRHGRIAQIADMPDGADPASLLAQVGPPALAVWASRREDRLTPTRGPAPSVSREGMAL